MNRGVTQHMLANSTIPIQIYEVQTAPEAEAMISLGVDRIGSVLLSADEWQMPSVKEAGRICKSYQHAKHSLIPLFDTRETLFRAVDYYEPDIIHFCDSLTNASQNETDENRCFGDHLIVLQAAIKDRFPDVQIMRSVPVARPGNAHRVPTLEIAKRFEPVTDCFLTDTWVENAPVAGFIGITGCICDWQMARELVVSSSIPVILAGGLSPENVYDAICAVQPFGVDSCTQTNAVDLAGIPIRFQKDMDRVRLFVEEAQRAAKALGR